MQNILDSIFPVITPNSQEYDIVNFAPVKVNWSDTFWVCGVRCGLAYDDNSQAYKSIIVNFDWFNIDNYYDKQRYNYYIYVDRDIQYLGNSLTKGWW